MTILQPSMRLMSATGVARVAMRAVRGSVDIATTIVVWCAVLVVASSLAFWRAAVLAVAVGIAVVVLAWHRRGYSTGMHVGRVMQHRLLLRSCLVVGSVVLVVDQVAGPGIGMAVVTVATLAAAVTQQAGRSLVDRWESRRRRSGQHVARVLVVSDGDSLLDVLDLIDEVPNAGWDVVACAGGCSAQARARHLEHVGPSHDVMADVDACAASVVVVTADALQDERCFEQLMTARRAGVDVHVHAGLRGLDHRDVRTTSFGRDTVLYLDHTRLLGCQRFLKRALDLTIAMSVLVVAAPILVVTALLVKLEDRGPVLFRQRRVGRGGLLFDMPKFRSMGVDAEAQQGDLGHLNERDGGPLFKIDHDPRVTRVGRVIRALSIDELPQLVSVLRGEMSLIGPRPALPDEVAEFDDRLASRHDVRPGLTGLWQVEARDDASFTAYRRLDLFYVDNWSLLLDFTILVHTIPAIVGRARRALHRRNEHTISQATSMAVANELVA